MKRPKRIKFTMEEHIECGENLRQIKGYLRTLLDRAKNAYGVKHKSIRPIFKMLGYLSDVRCALDTEVLNLDPKKEIPLNQLTRIYYGSSDNITNIKIEK